MVSLLVRAACLTCASDALSPRSYILSGNVIVLMVFRHVLWPCVLCLPSQAASQVFFPQLTLLPLGNLEYVIVCFASIRKKKLQCTVGFDKVVKK